MVDLKLAKRIVDFMNEALELDRDAISNLVYNNMVQCNKELAMSPTIQIASWYVCSSIGLPDVGLVGLIGILNGLCGVYDNNDGCIGTVSGGEHGNGKVSRFVLLDESGELI